MFPVAGYGASSEVNATVIIRFIMIKILHISKHALPETIGGIEAVVENLAKRQVSSHFDVSVLSVSQRNKSHTVSIFGYTIYFEKSLFSIGSTPFSWSFFKRVINISKKVDIIHIHFPYPFVDLCFWLIRPRKPTVITYHSDIVKQKFLKILYHPLMIWMFKRSECIVATSPNYFKTSKYLERFKDKVKIIPLGARDVYEKKLNLHKHETPIISNKYFLFSKASTAVVVCNVVQLYAVELYSYRYIELLLVAS